jgi:membrane-bound metal-dependent hydrolase YbcI (DUF457 family)
MGRRDRTLAGATARVAAPAAALVFLADALLTLDPPRPLAALLDETAHLATALLLGRALPLPAAPPFVAGAALGATIIDADHLPMDLLGSDILTRGAGRPVTHALPTVAALLLGARAARGPARAALLGATWGLATHLLRDAATGGVPLRWPRKGRAVRLPYALYALLLLGPALGALARPLPSGGERGD